MNANRFQDRFLVCQHRRTPYILDKSRKCLTPPICYPLGPQALDDPAGFYIPYFFMMIYFVFNRLRRGWKELEGLDRVTSIGIRKNAAIDLPEPLAFRELHIASGNARE